MKLGYFPGCSLHATSREFDESLKAISGSLDIELAEIKDWACCGATSAHASNHLLSIALPARTLAQAEAQNHRDLLAPCAACYSRLATARHAINESEKLSEKIRNIIGPEFSNSVNVKNIAHLLRDLAPSIQQNTKSPLVGLKVACYYGCLLVRPAEINSFDDPENPSSLEDIVRATGATPVLWNMRLDCCGGGFSLSRTGSVIRLGRAILDDAKANGADVIVVGCPMCHSNLDLRQKAMSDRAGQSFSIPILFVTQLVGLAFGLEPHQLGLNRHFVDTSPIIHKIRAPKSLPAATREGV
jgi:heterodisulfide reductase subunit B